MGTPANVFDPASLYGNPASLYGNPASLYGNPASLYGNPDSLYELELERLRKENAEKRCALEQASLGAQQVCLYGKLDSLYETLQFSMGTLRNFLNPDNPM
jgi:hypothetical protein